MKFYGKYSFVFKTKFDRIVYYIRKFPGEKTFGNYRFLPIFFLLGGAVEFTMINWTVGEINFYRVFKKKWVENEVERQLFLEKQLDNEAFNPKTAKYLKEMTSS